MAVLGFQVIHFGKQGNKAAMSANRGAQSYADEEFFGLEQLLGMHAYLPWEAFGGRRNADSSFRKVDQGVLNSMTKQVDRRRKYDKTAVQRLQERKAQGSIARPSIEAQMS